MADFSIISKNCRQETPRIDRMLKAMAPTKKRSGDSHSEAPKAKKGEGPAAANYQKYVQNERIFSLYQGKLYEAKVLELTEHYGEHGYYIHYQGWNKRHDEFVSEADAQTQFRKFNEETAEAVKREAQEARSSLNSSVVSTKSNKSTKSNRSTSKSAAKSSSKAKNGVKKEPLDFKAEDSDADSGSKSSKSTRKSGASVNGKAAKVAPHQLRQVKLEAKDEEAEQPAVRQRKIFDSVYSKQVVQALQKVLTDDSVATALAHVLTRDREQVLRLQKLPKIPADMPITKILQEYLETKGAKMPQLSDRVPEDYEKELCPKNSKPEEGVRILLNLFDATATAFALYPIEKALFKNLAEDNGRKENSTSNQKRLRARISHRVGFPYLIRLITRLDFVLLSGFLHEEVIEAFLSTCKDLGPFLAMNQNRFYNPQDHYVFPPADYLTRFKEESKRAAEQS